MTTKLQFRCEKTWSLAPVLQEALPNHMVNTNCQVNPVAQPIKLGGCGLRSLAELRHSAFVRGVEQAVPFLVPGDNGRETLCPALEQVVGSMAGERRWEEFLTAGSRTSREFGRGTERRARELVTAYERSLWKLDTRFFGTAPRQKGQPDQAPGPLVQRQRGYGRLKCLVVGPW